MRGSPGDDSCRFPSTVDSGRPSAGGALPPACGGVRGGRRPHLYEWL